VLTHKLQLFCEFDVFSCHQPLWQLPGSAAPLPGITENRTYHYEEVTTDLNRICGFPVSELVNLEIIRITARGARNYQWITTMPLPPVLYEASLPLLA
jgi:hypothetical protein